MSDFFERLAERAWGAATIVQPLIAPRYAPPSATPEPLLSGAESQLRSATGSPATSSPATESPITDLPAAESIEIAKVTKTAQRPPRNKQTGDVSVAPSDLRSSPAIQGPVAWGRQDSAAVVEFDKSAPAAQSPVTASTTKAIQSDVSQLRNLTKPRETPADVRAAPAAKLARSDSLAKPLSARPSVSGEASTLSSVAAALDDVPQTQLPQPAGLPVVREPAPWRPELSRSQTESRLPSVRSDPNQPPPAITLPVPAEPAVIQVTIGRIEVRAQLTAPTVRKAIPKSPTIGLDEYLNQQTRGRR